MDNYDGVRSANVSRKHHCSQSPSCRYSGTWAPKATSSGTGTSLFGTAPAASSTGGGSSLFGNNTTTAPASSGTSLFGAKPAAPATGGSSLFGGNTASSQPSTQPAASSGTSLFGGTLGGTQPATNTGGSVFSEVNLQRETVCSEALPRLNLSQLAQTVCLEVLLVLLLSQLNHVFGNDILPSAKNHSRQNDQPTRAFLQPNLHTSKHYSSAERRDRHKNISVHLESYHRWSSDWLISREKVKNIGQGGPSSGVAARGADARSHYLLSASGVNTNQALRDIDELANSTTGARNTVGELPDYNAYSDVKQGLTTYHVDKFQYLVDNHLKKAQADFDRMIDEQLHDVNWDAHRQRIYEHFGLKKPQGNGEASLQQSTRFGRSSARQSRLGGTSTMGQTFGLPGMAKSVIGTPGPRGARVSAFGDVADKLPEGMRPAPEDRIQRAKQERYCAKVTDLNVARLRESVYPVLKQPYEGKFLGSGAIRERHYAKDYLAESNQQGNNVIGKRIIRGSRKFLETLFYSELETTIAKSPREANIGGVPTSIAKVKGYVRVRASRKELGQDLELLQELNGDYCWPVIFYMLRSGLYQEALEYLEENQAAFRQIDRSFMRYLRSYVTSDEHRLPPDQQTAINNEYSQRQRLAPEDSIDPYRMMCYKSQTFTPHNYVSATHFAIALDYYGLLRVSDISNSEDLLSQTTRQEPQLAFGSMIGLYTRDFRTANATAAIDYLCLICLNKDLPGALGKSQRELCHQAITEVVLETREYASLLGDIRNDGQRIVGEIETRLRLIDIGTQEDFLRQITLVAARTADEQGRVTDAALLFHLAEDYDKVVQVINEAVSLALTADPNEQPMRWILLNHEMYPRIKPLNNFQATHHCISHSAILANGDMTAIRHLATAFNDMPTVVSRTIGHVMIWTVIACSNQVQHLRSLELQTDATPEAIRRCIGTAKDVMVFAA
ncbi:hypothetical protein MRB53_039990 [Persea americana]|nr:hypothetical protein MRB53_039990 [Persea americana]